jgi:hypothetical protein
MPDDAVHLPVLQENDEKPPFEPEPIELPVDQEPPKVRADCLSGGSNAQRPCQWFTCRHHLAVDVGRYGEGEGTESCVLDLAEKGGLTLEEVGDIMDLTRERIRQIEQMAMGKLRRLKRLRPSLFEG